MEKNYSIDVPNIFSLFDAYYKIYIIVCNTNCNRHYISFFIILF